MHTLPLSDIAAGHGDVFADNLMLCSADRLLVSRYASFAEDAAFDGGPTAAMLLGHDVLNLGALVDVLLCHDHVYVNAEYIDRWSGGESRLVEQMRDHVTAVETEPDFRWKGESVIIKDRSWPRTTTSWHGGHSVADGGPLSIAAVVLRASHCSDAHRAAEDADVQRRLLVPYDERSRPFGNGGVELAVGAGFYALCSQVLGLPYRPCALRGHVLSGMLRGQLREWRYQAGGLAMSLLQESGREAAEKYFEELADLNVVDTEIPAGLALVAADLDSPDDIIPRTLELRESSAGHAFRGWHASFMSAVQHGEVADIASCLRDVREAVAGVHREVGLEPVTGGTISVGWGPVRIGRPFDLPKGLGRPIRLRRHAWFLQDAYGALLTGASGCSLQRLLVEPLPTWFQDQLSVSGRRWPDVAQLFRPQTHETDL